MTGNAAIYFHDEGFRTDQPNVMGRQAAGHGFLKGFLAHATIDELVVYVESKAQREAFARLAAALGGRNAALTVRWAGPQDPRPLDSVGALHLPGPSLAGRAWHRRRHGAARWSLTGVTHTLATHHAMDEIGALLTGPVEPWDALICTSTAARRMIERLLDRHGAYLRERLGATRLARPLLPVIPLGVDCAAFDPGPAMASAARRRCRERLGIAAADPVVLFVGRLSWHAKAHPLPMYLGLEQAAAALGPAHPLHLIEAGQHTSAWIQDGFAEARQALMPGVRHHHLDGRDAAAMAEAWHAADVFCSLSDNIQETFGLTPVEAMAAGLPVVASDWDGYRDTLVHGETAILVPTALPAVGAGALLAERYEDGRDDYDQYCAQASLATTVDIAATAEALTALLGDPQRRAAMGAAGRARAKALFDWRVVIGRYQELWAELAAIREAAAAGPAAAGTAHPLRDSPFLLFEGYPTRLLDDATRLRAAPVPSEWPQRLERLRMCGVPGRPVGPTALAGRALARLRAAGATGLTQGQLVAAFPPAERGQVQLAVGWLLKTGLALPA